MGASFITPERKFNEFDVKFKKWHSARMWFLFRYKFVFKDDFDASALDTSAWAVNTWNQGGQKELQKYVQTAGNENLYR